MDRESTEIPDVRRGSAAVVVTHHPNAEVLENLRALRPQVGQLIVVDNGSSSQELSPIQSAIEPLRLDLIQNPENLGVATALNLGIERALTLQAEWILLFDQDSRVTPGFVDGMLHAFTTSTWGSRLAILTPQYKDMQTGYAIPASRVREGIEIAMTSGSLLRAETFRFYGLFRDELFIDSVDHEYSFRLRKTGLVLEETPAATLLHALGSPAPHTLLRQKPVWVANYSPTRRYYQERNKIWMARHYGSCFPGFFLKQFTLSLKDLFKIVLMEKDSGRKVRFFLRGIADGLRGRMGKLDERPSKNKQEE